MAFKAFMIQQNDGKVSGSFVELDESDLDPGEVLIAVTHSSINYKDALAATGAGRIIRRFPCIAGIDLAGHVLSSTDQRFAAGEEVIATSYDIGVAHHGGFSERARIPAGWVQKLPRGMSRSEAMALGTAGFTAGLGIVRMEENGLRPANGPVVVSGATGGVGSLAIDMLAARGYHVVALTGKEGEADYLKELGAKEVLLRQSLELSKIKPLGRELWAGAIDNLGGDILAWIASTMKQGGTIASIGLASSMALNTTVAPFILRGASLLGIDSGYIGEPYRTEIWKRLATDLKPLHLHRLSRHIPFSGLPSAFNDFISGRARGRVVVNVIS